VLILHVGDETLLDFPLRVFRQIDSVVKVELVNARPHFRRDRTAELCDQRQLMLLRRTLHDGASDPHLRHDASRAPEIDGRAVVPLAQQKLRRSIPQRHHAIRVPIGLRFLERLGKGAGEAEVGKFEQTVFGDENIGGFHVAMKDLVAVNVVETVEQLLHDFLDLAEIELDVDVAQESGEIVIAEIENEIKGGFEAIVLGRLGAANLLQVDDVVVFEQLQDLDLPQRRDGKSLLFILHQNLLEGDEGSSLFVSRFEYFPESSLADLSKFFVLGRHIVAEGVIQGRLESGRGGGGGGRGIRRRGEGGRRRGETRRCLEIGRRRRWVRSIG